MEEKRKKMKEIIPLTFNVKDLEEQAKTDGLACYILGRSYDSGENGVDQDLAKAVYWYEEGTKKNDPRAIYGLAACYDFGDGVEQDKKKAYELFVDAYPKLLNLIEEEQRNPERQAFSIFCLGAYYYFGFGDVIEDKTKAFELINDAAEKGHIAAIYDLGANFYYTGTGTNQNLEKSRYYLELAASYNLPRAKNKLLEYQDTYQKKRQNMIKAIIYQSKTGHTKEYAETLSKELKIPCYSVSDAKEKLQQQEEIIYLSWVRATTLVGYKKINKKYQIICLGAVGAYPKSNEYLKQLKEYNHITQELFYFRGGINYEKLNKFYQKLLKLVGKAITMENPRDKEMSLLFEKGGNFVNPKQLKSLVEYIKEKMG